jgi:hypothetical protein
MTQKETGRRKKKKYNNGNTDNWTCFNVRLDNELVRKLNAYAFYNEVRRTDAARQAIQIFVQLTETEITKLKNKVRNRRIEEKKNMCV